GQAALCRPADRRGAAAGHSRGVQARVDRCQAGEGVHALREGSHGRARQIARVSDRKSYPVLLLAVGAGVLFLSALFLVFFVSMQKDSNEELCRANLTIIGIAIRGGELPSSPKWDSAGRGREFFA